MAPPTEDSLATLAVRLGSALRERRNRRGWTRKALRSNLGTELSLQTLASYECGTRSMSVGRYVEICIALEVDPGRLLREVCESVFRAVASVSVPVDLTGLATTTVDRLRPVANWARLRVAKLPRGHSRIVALDDEALAHLALLCGITQAELVEALRELGSN